VKYKCFEEMSSDGWHWSKCGRPAKKAWRITGSTEKYKPVCGIHSRRYDNNKDRYEVIDITKEPQ